MKGMVKEASNESLERLIVLRQNFWCRFVEIQLVSFTKVSDRVSFESIEVRLSSSLSQFERVSILRIECVSVRFTQFVLSSRLPSTIYSVRFALSDSLNAALSWILSS